MTKYFWLGGIFSVSNKALMIWGSILGDEMLGVEILAGRRRKLLRASAPQWAPGGVFVGFRSFLCWRGSRGPLRRCRATDFESGRGHIRSRKVIENPLMLTLLGELNQ